MPVPRDLQRMYSFCMVFSECKTGRLQHESCCNPIGLVVITNIFGLMRMKFGLGWSSVTSTHCVWKFCGEAVLKPGVVLLNDSNVNKVYAENEVTILC